ncbi:hypothetical protein [Streptococcus marmotae]|uniref:hypothetical protein n=1 Tax=Streptococcus marmotae TaxID=1825069 RepID=UPI00082CA126|nr:hypothetical protein [Streptococcus marmotae]
MKNLRQYQEFNHTKFFNEHSNLIVKGIASWEDYTTKTTLGSKLSITIMNNDSENFLETFNIKVKQNIDNLHIKQGERIMIFDIEKASIYGDYQNNLSLEAKIRKWSEHHEKN